LQFKDGAIKGIDLAGMVRNTAASFGLAVKPKTRPKTDFAELVVPFTIQNGLVNVSQTTLNSPLLRLKASGDADLNKETLNFRIEPLFVATLVGQGDTRQRTGIMVPVLVSGTFKDPKYRPDLQSMLKQHIDVGKEVDTLKKGIQEKLPGKQGTQKLEEKKNEIEKGAKDLLKGLPFGK
jgi:AsmA protein